MKSDKFACTWKFNTGTDEEPQMVEQKFRDHLFLASTKKCIRCGEKKYK